jgi:hypothetical protein
MFLQNQHVQCKSQDRPNFLRSSRSAECHPSQAKRALLGDTRGAVYLPSGDETLSEFLARPVPAGHLVRSSSERGSTVRFQQSIPVLGDMARRLSGQHQNQEPKSTADLPGPQRPNEPALAIDGSISRCTSNHPGTQFVDSSHDNQRDLQGTDLADIGRSVEATETPCHRRTSSLSETNLHPKSAERRPIVHFASRPALRDGLEQDSLVPPEAQHHVHQLTPVSTFKNPFERDDEPRSRTGSTSSSSSTTDYFRPGAFAGHRDTLARIETVKPCPIDEAEESDQSPSLPSVNWATQTLKTYDTYEKIHSERRWHLPPPIAMNSVVDRLMGFLDHRDYLNLRLTSRLWYNTLLPLEKPAAYRVPREVLIIIFSHLTPCDFDAARHTCRKWFDDAMDLYLLRMTLRSLQCQHGHRSDLRKCSQSAGSIRVNSGQPSTAERRTLHVPAPSERSVSDTWLMAKRVATATRLSPDWRGPWSRQSTSQGESRFHLIEQVDFSSIMSGPFSSLESADNWSIFNVSTCGKYLLVLSGHNVFVYDLYDPNNSLAPLIRLVADRNLTRVSMDTSSGRLAVAAILENHTGVLWDLAEADGQPGFHTGEPMSLGMQTEVYTSQAEDDESTLAAHLPLRRRELISEHDVGSYQNAMASAEREEQAATGPLQLLEPVLDASLCATPETQSDDAGPSTGITVLARPSATYHNLGGPDDAPRSVAICPSRRCVAFGTRLGIELHWVDAMTGGDLNRWFPLAAPSDHLYFLPQRIGLDSNRKLRLISSAAGLSDVSLNRRESLPARILKRARTHDRGRRQSLTRLFFGSLPFPSSTVFPTGWWNSNSQLADDRQGVLRTVDCDHYRAVPMSDGFHMLYTDPANGLLCMGSDAPLGGPSKLIRKVMFVQPTSTSAGSTGFPTCYTAGADLSWGVRVVSAHRDGRVILYNVPADLFSFIQHQRGANDIWDENAGVLAQSDLLMDDILSVHRNTLTTNIMADTVDPETPMRTVQIEGVEIANVGSDIVDDVAVDTSSGGVKVWVFCRSGIARLLNIYADLGHRVRQRYVGADGLLYESPMPGFRFVEAEEGQSKGKGKERARSEDEAEGAGFRRWGLDGI